MQPQIRPHGACRAAIIGTLHGGPRTLAQLAAALPCPSHCLASNLGRLREAGVICCRQQPTGPADETGVLYELNAASVPPQPIRLFTRLAPTDLVMLATAARLLRYEPGEIVFLEGGDCQGLYLVDSGLVRLSTQGQWLEESGQCSTVRQQILELVGPGGCIGAVAALDGGPNATTAEAIEESHLLQIPLPVVANLLKSSPTFASALAMEIGTGLRHALAMVQDLSLRNVDARIAKVLLQREDTRPGIGAGAHCRARLTQHELAEMAGTVREVAARSLKRLESRGAIRLQGGQIAILDRDALRRAL